jgi:hypothetical protein
LFGSAAAAPAAPDFNGVAASAKAAVRVPNRGTASI